MIENCLYPILGLAIIISSLYFITSCLMFCRRGNIPFANFYKVALPHFVFAGSIIIGSIFVLSIAHLQWILPIRMAFQAVLLAVGVVVKHVIYKSEKFLFWLILFPVCPGVVFYVIKCDLSTIGRMES